MDAIYLGVYLGVLLAVSVAVVSLSFVWFSALRDALGAGDTAAGARSAQRFWVLLILVLGWPGALLYWHHARSRFP